MAWASDSASGAPIIALKNWAEQIVQTAFFSPSGQAEGLNRRKLFWKVWLHISPPPLIHVFSSATEAPPIYQHLTSRGQEHAQAQPWHFLRIHFSEVNKKRWKKVCLGSDKVSRSLAYTQPKLWAWHKTKETCKAYGYVFHPLPNGASGTCQTTAEAIWRWMNLKTETPIWASALVFLPISLPNQECLSNQFKPQGLFYLFYLYWDLL